MKNNILFLLLGLTILLNSCQQTQKEANTESKKDLIKVTILYPNSEGKTFNMDYYANKHMPMLDSLFGDALKKLEIDKGISGRTPSDTIPFLAIGYLYFDSLEEYRKAFAPNAAQIVGDIPNYTNIQPIVQISEVYE